MNVNPLKKYKGLKTIKQITRRWIKKNSNARTLKGGGWGKSKSSAADNKAKQDKNEAQKVAKAEQKKLKADAEAAKKEAKKTAEAEKKAEKDKLKAEKKRLKEAAKEKKANKEAKEAEAVKAEEGKAEEGKVEEPKAAEAKAEEPKAEAVKADEAKATETKAEAVNVEKTKPNEVKANEAKEEEAKAEAPVENTKKTLQLGENLPEESETEGAEQTVEGAEQTVEGAEQTVEGAEQTVEGAEQPVEGAEQPVEGAVGDEEQETLAEDEDETAEEKPWWKKAKNGMSNAMKGTLKKTKKGLGAIGTAVKSPVKLYKSSKKQLFYAKETLKGFKKTAANFAEKYSPIRQGQRFRNWRKRTAKAKSDAKFNKYIDRQYERQQKIAKLQTDRANILASNKPQSEKDAELAELDNKIASEKKKQKWDDEKVKEWASKQKKATTDLKDYTEYLGKKTGPVKNKLDEKLKTETTSFLNSPVAKANAQKEIDAEINSQFAQQEQAAKNALAQDNDYLAAQTLANSPECGITTGKVINNSNNQKCEAAKATIATKKQALDKLLQDKDAAKKAKEAELQKRILKAHSMDLIGPNLQKLTKSMRLPDEISTPGTPEHTELQEKIRAHIDQHGTMPPADEISKMVAATAYEQTLSNTAKDMAKEIRDATTAGKAAYKYGDTALANISHPQAKSGVINKSIEEFIPKLETKITELQKPLTKNSSESQASHLRMTQTVLRTVKQMTAAKKPPEEIYKFISRYNSEFGATIAQKANNLEANRQKLKVGSQENTNAVERYYKAQMAKFGYTNFSADPTPTPALIAFAKNYYTGPIPLNKTGQMTPRQIKIALDNYKQKYLPSRIANNPDILNKLQKSPVAVSPKPVIAKSLNTTSTNPNATEKKVNTPAKNLNTTAKNATANTTLVKSDGNINPLKPAEIQLE
jgi:hypothetical protein